MNSNSLRTWKDEFSRQSSGNKELTRLSQNPLGELELTDSELGSVFAAGGHCEHQHNTCGNFRYRRDDCSAQMPYQSVSVRVRFDWGDWRSYRHEGYHHDYSCHSDFDDCRPCEE